MTRFIPQTLLAALLAISIPGAFSTARAQPSLTVTPVWKFDTRG